MKRIIQSVIAALIWLFALGCAYVGIIFLLFGPMMGPRGDIDYVAFSEAQKQAADREALLTQLFALIPLAVSVLSFLFSVKIAKYMMRIWPGGAA